MKKTFLALFVLFCSYSAFGWDCSNPLAERVLVPSTTTGTYGDGDGQLALYQGQLYECEVVKPSTDPKGTAVTATNTNNNSNSNSNTNNNTNTLNQTQGQKQGQTQSNASTNNNASTATNAGNDSAYNNVETTNIKPESSSAITPTLIPTAPCLGSIGGAAQSVPGGISFGASRVDKGCDARQTALLFAVTLHNPDAAARIMCATRAAKAAKLTLAQCLAFVLPVAIAPLPTAAPVPPVTVVLAPAPEVKPVVVVITEPVTVTPTPAQLKLIPKATPKHKPVMHKTCPVIPESLKEKQ